MRKKLSFPILSLAFSLLFSVTSFAQNYEKIYNGDVAQYLDESGNIKTGYFFDDLGNFYKTDNNGNLVTSRDTYKQVYIDGELIIPGLESNVELNRERCKLFENGEVITFNSGDELYQFLEYYYGQYQLYLQNLYFDYDTTGGPATDKNEYLLRNEKFYNRDEVCNLIDEKFGDINGETSREKLVNILIKLKEMEYSKETVRTPLEDAIKDMKGCCWHYSKIASYLLNKEGIYTEIISGKIIDTGESHCWIRSYIDDKWQYIDPTFYVTGSNPFYVDIAYVVYQSMYAQTGCIFAGPYLR